MSSWVTRFLQWIESWNWFAHHWTGFFSSLNRVFVVETFTMLISQKQALVSSDTSCAVGNRQDFFVRPHFTSSLYFFYYHFQYRTPSPSLRNSKWLSDERFSLGLLSTAPSKPSFQVVCLHKWLYLWLTPWSRQLSSILHETKSTRTPHLVVSARLVYHCGSLEAFFCCLEPAVMLVLSSVWD